MIQIKTHELKQGAPLDHALDIYNALDACVTLEVHEELSKIFPQPNLIYDFERAMQAPALEMMLRGFKVDQYERAKAIASLHITLERLQHILYEYAFACWGKSLNPRSPKQLIEFFYGMMKLPEQWSSHKGVRKLSTNRETLEKLEVYFHARPIIACILAIRDTSKRLEVLETEVDADGRMRTSYNIAGTETGRWSSSSSSTGTGTNLQNITPELRRIFIADTGKKLCGIDLEQAESRDVGWLCGTILGDWSYLDACEGGDLHTTTARLIWPELKWTGNPKRDKEVAEQLFYRQFTYRDMSKRGGHGTTYLGTPFTMARHLKVPTRLMEEFQSKFFSAYPCIPRWHRWVAQQLQTTQQLTTPLGRRRHFFGRPNDDATLREAVAFSPQSTTADRMSLGLWRIWKHMGRKVEILAQLHDAIYLQFDEKADEAAIVSEVLKHCRVELKHQDRIFAIPAEAKTGWNWSSYHPEKNPEGLKKFIESDSRTRRSSLDRIL